MNRRAASGRLQERDEKACSERLLRLDAQTYQPYVRERPKDNNAGDNNSFEADFLVKPAY